MLTSKYLLRWHHVEFGNDKSVPSKHRGKRGTIAKVYERQPYPAIASTRVLVATGITSCSPSERVFNKAKGRFNSMERAIADLPRWERGEFYEQFFAETHPSKIKEGEPKSSSNPAKVRMS